MGPLFAAASLLRPHLVSATAGVRPLDDAAILSALVKLYFRATTIHLIPDPTSAVPRRASFCCQNRSSRRSSYRLTGASTVCPYRVGVRFRLECLVADAISRQNQAEELLLAATVVVVGSYVGADVLDRRAR